MGKIDRTIAKIATLIGGGISHTTALTPEWFV